MKLNKKFPGGIWPVMLTPYTDDNKIDEQALSRLTDWYIENGVNGLFAACQSSEIFYLNLEERLRIVETTLRTAHGRVPVIASANISDSIEDQAKELNAVWKLGVDAVIILSNRLAAQDESSEVWIANLKKLLDLLDPDMKLGIYECPYPYKRVVNDKELQAMLDTNRFYFFKDTCCDIKTIRRKIEQIKGSSIQLFNANTSTLLESLRDGADGYCGVMANFHPKLYVWIYKHYMEEKAEKVSDILTMNSLIERQLYPVNAKWHLKNIEKIPMNIYARSQDCNLLTDTFIKEVQAMDNLSKETYKTYCSDSLENET